MPRKNPIPEAPPPIEAEEGVFIPDDDPAADAEALAEQAHDHPIAPIEEPAPVPEGEIIVNPPERAVVIAPTQHRVTGLAALASMSEEAFTAEMAVMKSGQDRIRRIQKELLVEGEDYGHVKGIARPFLQQPGAEKLANFYGYALRQETKRIVGDGVIAPNLSYETTTFVHLGDFDGSIVAQGIGEANSWEEKYRWRNAMPTCPECGRPDLVKRKNPPELAGKWSCPSWQGKGGCGRNFEANDPRISAGGKVENTDPYGMAETLVQMSAKRSMVAGVRRATGTSGLFTQDDDSPSVRQQSGDAPESGNTEGAIEAAESTGIEVLPGAKTAEATKVQHDRMKSLVAEKALNGAKIASLLERIFSMEVAPNGASATAAVRTLDADQMGKLLLAIETGEVPDPAAEAAAPTKATN